MTELVGTKSVFLSKTNIVGLLLAAFGLLNTLGLLPAGLDATTLVNSIVTVGGVLVMIFRTFASKKLAVAPAA